MSKLTVPRMPPPIPADAKIYYAPPRMSPEQEATHIAIERARENPPLSAAVRVVAAEVKRLRAIESPELAGLLAALGV